MTDTTGNIAVTPGAQPRHVEEEFRVPFEHSGLRLFLRHRSPGVLASNVAPHSVLFVHGATFPSALAAAYPFGGRSWMQDLADAGFDTWALDFMGYGESDRYPQMSDSSYMGPPLLRAEEASRQIAAASEFIRKRRGISRLSIVAHSWGTLATGIFAANFGATIERLVFFGPPTLRHAQPAKPVTSSAAWDVTIAAQMDRFRGYLPQGQTPVLEEHDMPAWSRAYLASDPNSAGRTPPSVRVPSGPVADIELAARGSFPYQPGEITVPVLIVRGEWDDITTHEDADWLYRHLRNAPIRRDVRISRGTHVMHLEQSRFQLYRQVQTFLAGGDT